MGILSWIVLGGLAGWVASMITGKNQSMGIILNIVVGIVGAFIGGFIFSTVGGTPVTGFNLWSFFVAFVGAVVLLFIIGLITKKSN